MAPSPMPVAASPRKQVDDMTQTDTSPGQSQEQQSSPQHHHMLFNPYAAAAMGIPNFPLLMPGFKPLASVQPVLAGQPKLDSDGGSSQAPGGGKPKKITSQDLAHLEQELIAKLHGNRKGIPTNLGGQLGGACAHLSLGHGVQVQAGLGMAQTLLTPSQQQQPLLTPSPTAPQLLPSQVGGPPVQHVLPLQLASAELPMTQQPPQQPLRAQDSVDSPEKEVSPMDGDAAAERKEGDDAVEKSSDQPDVVEDGGVESESVQSAEPVGDADEDKLTEVPTTDTPAADAKTPPPPAVTAAAGNSRFTVQAVKNDPLKAKEESEKGKVSAEKEAGKTEPEKVMPKGKEVHPVKVLGSPVTPGSPVPVVAHKRKGRFKVTVLKDEVTENGPPTPNKVAHSSSPREGTPVDVFPSSSVAPAPAQPVSTTPPMSQSSSSQLPSSVSGQQLSGQPSGALPLPPARPAGAAAQINSNNGLPTLPHHQHQHQHQVMGLPISLDSISDAAAQSQVQATSTVSTTTTATTTTAAASVAQAVTQPTSGGATGQISTTTMATTAATSTSTADVPNAVAATQVVNSVLPANLPLLNQTLPLALSNLVVSSPPGISPPPSPPPHSPSPDPSSHLMSHLELPPNEGPNLEVRRHSGPPDVHLPPALAGRRHTLCNTGAVIPEILGFNHPQGGESSQAYELALYAAQQVQKQNNKVNVNHQNQPGILICIAFQAYQHIRISHCICVV